MTINSLDIREFRKKNGLTQGELAEILGLSERTVQNYESGGVIPKTKTAIFRKIFDNYDKGISEVFVSIDGKQLPIREITRFIMYNEDLFFEDKGFLLWFNSHINKAVKEFLEEQGIEVVYTNNYKE